MSKIQSDEVSFKTDFKGPQRMVVTKGRMEFNVCVAIKILF